MEFSGKHILLGVTGGIAAYKSVELLRLMKKAGADVTVSMTDAAMHFVGKTTFEVLSENPVLSDLWTDTQSSVTHIDVAARSHACVVAPATANCIGKLAHGIADDALTTTMLALTCPVMICPSMNTDMYQNIRVQQNLDSLESTGYHIIDPDSGALACKTVGAGRLPEPWFIFDRLCALLTPKDLEGKKILISAGPTQEAIDPVRYITNHSSGKMGYAIARAAEQRGASVTLVSGPVHLEPPVGVEVVPVESCGQMADAMLDRMEAADIIIKVAAVADYRPTTARDKKIKKQDGSADLTLNLTETQDILKEIGRRKTKDQFLVGFAAETHDLQTHALAKMKKKNLDMIAANLVGGQDTGFKTDTNELRLFCRDGQVTTIPLMEKQAVAHQLLDAVIARAGAS